uniref:Uncharacterized protein n=1 Tax=Aegilops tauschii subsp. strangulata TaxID=200361 RepID=A0A453K2C2_AEGTS
MFLSKSSYAICNSLMICTLYNLRNYCLIYFFCCVCFCAVFILLYGFLLLVLDPTEARRRRHEIRHGKRSIY